MKINFRSIPVLIFLLMMAGSSIHAQRFIGGIMAGGVTSQVDGDTSDGYHKFGYLGGAYVGLVISPHASFQMELEYIQKGSRRGDTSTNGGNGNTYLLRLHYIEVPFLFQYTFKKRFYFEAGPAADVIIGSLELRDGIEVAGVPFRPVCFTGIFGFGAYVTNHLRINVRSNYSLNSLRSVNTASYYRRMVFEIGQYNNVLSLSLLWDFKAKDF